jgi:hypothetical protein
VDLGRTREPKPLGHFTFASAAPGVGVVAGLGAAVFRALIALFHNLLILGRVSLSYDANMHTPASPWGAAAVLVPVIGALGVAFLIKKLRCSLGSGSTRRRLPSRAWQGSLAEAPARRWPPSS